MMTKKISRRQFLTKTAAAGVAIGFHTIVPSSVFGSNAPSNRVTLGFIGVGGQGSVLLNGFLNLPQCYCMATCDPFKDRKTE